MCGTSTSDITGTTVWCSTMIFAAAANGRKVRNVNLHFEREKGEGEGGIIGGMRVWDVGEGENGVVG